MEAFFRVELGDADCNTRFENVRLQGTELPVPLFGVFTHQPIWGIDVQGVRDAFPSLSSGGTHVVRKSEISKVGFATRHQHFKNASIEITRNTFSDVNQILTHYLDGADVSITGNTMNSSSLGAIVVTQEGEEIPGDASNVVIRGNNVSVSGLYGIEIGTGTGAGFNLLIEENTINVGPDPILGFPNDAGIGLFAGQEGAMVRNNIITGEAEYGILAEGVNNSVFKGNDLQGFTPGVAHYGLDVESNHNRIVLQGFETVQDDGFGNVIVREDDDEDED